MIRKRAGIRLRGLRTGAAVVEFAVVAPVMILFTFAILELSRGVMVRQSLANAARCGCRVAILDGSSRADVEGAVQAALAATGIGNTQVDVTPADFGSADSGEFVEVKLTVNFADVTWLPVPQFIKNENLTEGCTMPHE